MDLLGIERQRYPARAGELAKPLEDQPYRQRVRLSL